MKINSTFKYIVVSFLLGAIAGLYIYKFTYNAMLVELMFHNDISNTWRESLYLEHLNKKNYEKIREVLELKIKLDLDSKSEKMQFISEKRKKDILIKYKEIKSRYENSTNKKPNKQVKIVR